MVLVHPNCNEGGWRMLLSDAGAGSCSRHERGHQSLIGDKKSVSVTDLEQRMNNIFLWVGVCERKRDYPKAWIARGCVCARAREKGCLLKHCLYGYTLPGDELYVGMEWPSRGHEMSVSRNPTEPGVIVLRSGCLVTPLQPTDSEKWPQHWGTSSHSLKYPVTC